MKIVIAPDKFKGSLTAEQAANALTSGVRDAIPDVEILAIPLADGGDGTAEILATAMAAECRVAEVLDPLGRPIKAKWYHVPKADIAIIEMAEASGLRLLSEPEHHPLNATTFGTGQLIQAAIDAGVSEILLGVGGSATVDGGVGCLQALGFSFYDQARRPMAGALSAKDLPNISHIDQPSSQPAINITIYSDVDNPLLGTNGAAAVFAPQKGATPEQVRELEANLAHWANVCAQTFGKDCSQMAGTGAAGGLPFGLVAAMDGSITSGFDEVAKRVGFTEALADCDLCITGEGRLDAQTERGKVVFGVASQAKAVGVPVVAFVGSVQVPPRQTIDDVAQSLGLRAIVPITPTGTPLSEAYRLAAENLRHAVSGYLRGLS